MTNNETPRTQPPSMAPSPERPESPATGRTPLTQAQSSAPTASEVTPQRPFDRTRSFRPELFTREDAQAREAAAEAKQDELSEKYTFGDVASTAYNNEQIIPLLFQAFGKEKLAPDPNFAWNEQLEERVRAEVPKELWGEFNQYDIHSEGHFEQRMAEIKLMQEANEKLFSKGVGTGLAASVTASLFDPAALAIALGSEGALVPLVITQKATRLQRIVQSGLIATGSGAAVESSIAGLSDQYDARDALIGTLAAGVLGGAIGAARKLPETEISQLIALREIQEAGLQLSDDGRRVFNDFITPEGNIRTPEEMNADWFSLRADHTTSFSPLRVDRASDNFSSGSEKVRKLSGALIEDPAARSGELVGETAELWKKRVHSAMMVEYLRNRKTNLANYRRETGSRFGNRLKSEEEFAEQVTFALRGQEVASAAAREQAEVVRKLFDDITDMAQNPARGENLPGAKSVLGAEDMQVDNYVNRVWSGVKMQALRDQIGPEGVQRKIAAAIRGYDEEVSMKIASHIMAIAQRSRHGGLDINGLRNNLDNLENFLRREHGLSADQATSMADSLRRLTGGDDAGRAANLKHRLDIDESQLSDLLENNIDALFQSYANRMTGHIALARQGIGSEDDFKKLLEDAKEEVYARGFKSKREQSKQERELRNLEEAYDFLVGRPTVETNPGSLANTFFRIVRKLQVSRLMNMVGTAQIGEIGVVTTQAGVVAAIRNVPELGKLLRSRKADGTFDDELLEELQVLTGGFGEYRLLQRSNQRIEDFGSPNGAKDRSGWGMAERAADRLSETTMDISGFNFINQALQAWAGKSLAQSFLDSARRGGKHRLGEARLAQLGIDPQTLREIQREMMKSGGASWTKNGTLKKLNIDNWEPTVANKFGNALARQGRLAIQEGDFGAGIRWTESAVGKVLMQFKSFMMGSWTKQVLNNVNHADRISFLQFQNTLLAGMLSYITYVGITAQGRADSKDFMDRMLEPERIAAGAFQRSSVSTFFPGLIDSGAMLMGFDPMFDQRASGLSSGGLGANPTFDYAEKMYNMVSEVSELARGGEVTQQTLRGFLSVLPFQNAIGIRNAANVAYGELPRRYE